jgi:cytochrome bd-type quinol oxidase subunit 2
VVCWFFLLTALTVTFTDLSFDLGAGFVCLALKKVDSKKSQKNDKISEFAKTEAECNPRRSAEALLRD